MSLGWAGLAQAGLGLGWAGPGLALGWARLVCVWACLGCVQGHCVFGHTQMTTFDAQQGTGSWDLGLAQDPQETQEVQEAQEAQEALEAQLEVAKVQ